MRLCSRLLIPVLISMFVPFALTSGTAFALFPVAATSQNTIAVDNTLSLEDASITADPEGIENDGIETSTITVQMRDGFGGNVADCPPAGKVLELSTTAGSLGAPSSCSNGVFTATLTSSTTEETATITGEFTEDGQPTIVILDNATVDFLPGMEGFSLFGGEMATELQPWTEGQPVYNVILDEPEGGTAPYTWTLPEWSEPLPDGLALSPDGIISGTPMAAGTFEFTLEVTDSADPAATTNPMFSITINEPPSVATTTLPDGTVGAPYSEALAAADGTAPYAWALAAGSDPLPDGLTLDPDTGAITGTPSSAGEATFTVTVTDAADATDDQALTLTIGPAGDGNGAEGGEPLAVTSTTLPAWTAGQAGYTATLEASGGAAPYAWAVTAGALPDGLALDAGTGAISGTPSTDGTAGFTVTVTDDAEATDEQALSITVNSAPAVTTTTLADGSVGQPYSQLLAASGGTAPLAWSVTSGALPAGLTLDASSGAISGTPTTDGARRSPLRSRSPTPPARARANR